MRFKSIALIFFLIAVSFFTGSVGGSAMAAQGEATPVVQQAPAAKININTASAAELEQLPGIGAKIAEEIVKHREAIGPFKTVQDLKQVKGIGDKKLEAIQERITTE